MVDNSIDDSSPNGIALGIASRLRRIGPSIIVAAVVLGPGSIVNASRVGCEFGLALLWVVPLAGLLMMGMTVAGMSIGLLDSQTPCTWIARRLGRPAAMLVGGSLFAAITLYQASNNNAMIMAWQGLVGRDASASTAYQLAGLAGFNAALIVMLLFGSSEHRRGINLYQKLERAMMPLVAVMVLAFSISMVAARPDPLAILRGLVPRLPDNVASAAESVRSARAQAMALQSWLGVTALIATTFSVAGAFFQSYQVKEKGWTPTEIRTGSIDAFIGVGTLTMLTMVLFITAASALHRVTPVTELVDANAVAVALRPMFGDAATFIFSVGVFAGAISSFVVNAIIGGVAIVDGLGKSCRFDAPSVRWATAATLTAGYLVAALATIAGINLVRFIVVAQSLTILAFPVLAATMLGQAWSNRHRGLSMRLLLVTGAGLILVCLMSMRTVWLLLGR
ncbi:MAG: divalent metal cation transporter [Planctomycetota bacterium]